MAAALVAGLLPLAITFANAQQPIAEATGAIPAAFGQFGDTQTTIVAGTTLFEGQVITTNGTGQVEIVFTDNTHMVIGPNSSLIIERILMRNQNTISDFAVDALGGTFRFISGNSPSEAYTINTPTGTIAVRGTALDITVQQATGRTDIMLYQGAIIACPDGGQCILLEDVCNIGTIISSTGAGVYNDETQRVQAAQSLFPFARSQQTLQTAFRIGNASTCLQPQTTELPAAVPAGTPPAGGGAPGTPPPATSGEEPPPGCERDNNGVGNGGECDEGGVEGGNPGNPGNGGNGGGGGGPPG